MSTAQTIIEGAYTSLGVNSEVSPVATSLIDAALPRLQAILEELRKNEIILEETVSSVTTTIVQPTALSTELNEPVAARTHLEHLLAVYLIPLARVPASSLKIPKASKSERELAKMYRVHDIPNITPSKLLPRGQGAKGGRLNSAFFQGNELADDVSTSS